MSAGSAEPAAGQLRSHDSKQTLLLGGLCREGPGSESLAALLVGAGGGGPWWPVTQDSEMRAQQGKSSWDLSVQQFLEGTQQVGVFSGKCPPPPVSSAVASGQT